MFRLIYASRSNPILDGSEVYSLLATSKRNNKEHALTGVLLYGQGYFLQVLEGDRDEVNRDFQLIVADQRHHDVRIIEAANTGEREFSEWSMEIIGWPDEIDSRLKKILRETTGEEELRPFELDRSQVVSFLKRLVKLDGLMGRL